MNLSEHTLQDEATLRAEIQCVEQHLVKIAGEDDCAYGKARIRAFETLLLEQRRRLDVLVSAATNR